MPAYGKYLFLNSMLERFAMEQFCDFVRNIAQIATSQYRTNITSQRCSGLTLQPWRYHNIVDHRSFMFNKFRYVVSYDM